MPKAYIVAGLGFGDEGKGTITDYLVRKNRAKLVVRYNGGCQAAHNVVTIDGKHHTFSQFGSGTLAGADTHLSRFMLIDPLALMNEAKTLSSIGVAEPMSMISVDPKAIIVTPFHRMTNRLREQARGNDRHGSVGVGIGEAREDQIAGVSLHVSDLASRDRTLRALSEIRDRKLAVNPDLNLAPGFADIPIHSLFRRYREFYESVGVAKTENILAAQFHNVVFEGAQGVLLDEEYGIEPYRSWTNCTFGNAFLLLEDVRHYSVERIGVLRTYFTRHGAGPFPTEDQGLKFEEPHNVTHPFMGGFRQGHFDCVLAKYAIEAVGGIDTLAFTHCDVLSHDIQARIGDSNPWHPEAVRYDRIPSLEDLAQIGLELVAPLIKSVGPTWIDKTESERTMVAAGGEEEESENDE